MKAAAERSHVGAQFNVAKMYAAGRGAARDAALTRVWLQRAASQGHEEAAKLLAEASLRPEPREPNLAQAGAREALRKQADERALWQRGLAMASRNDRPEILDAAWRGSSIRKMPISGASIAARDDLRNTAYVGGVRLKT